jgi:transposase
MLEGLTPPKKARPCKVRETIEALEPKDQEILKAAITDPAWQTLTLANSLKERGISISESPLRNHRAGRCSCNA